MMAPTSLFDRPGRAAAVVGAVIAVSATAAVVLVSGTAAAQEPGRCTENVNVRSEPDVTSRIVALCEAGTEVQTGEARDGFVQLPSLGGWAAQEYISVNGSAPAPAERASASESASEDENEDGNSSEGSETADDAGTDTGTAEDGTGDESTDEESSDTVDQDGDDTAAQPSGGGLGGLLG